MQGATQLGQLGLQTDLGQAELPAKVLDPADLTNAGFRGADDPNRSVLWFPKFQSAEVMV